MSNLTNRYKNAISLGFFFECGCARLYKTSEAAKSCKFCGEYRARGLGGAATARDVRSAL